MTNLVLSLSEYIGIKIFVIEIRYDILINKFIGVRHDNRVETDFASPTPKLKKLGKNLQPHPFL